MPLQAESSVSAYFYRYGKAFTSRSICFLLLSIFLVSLCSYSVILDALNSFGFNANPHDVIDAHFWQYSPYIRLENITTTTTTTTTTPTTKGTKTSTQTTPRLIAQQIRIANKDNIINNELLEHVQNLQDILTTTVVYVDRKPVSLATICLTKRGQCMIHSPLEYYKNRNDGSNSNYVPIIGVDGRHDDKNHWVDKIHQWHHQQQQHHSSPYLDESTSTGLPMHPYSVFGNATLDPFGRFLKADSIILTILLQTTNHLDYTQRVWNALWKHTTQQLQMGELSSPSSLKQDNNDQQHYNAWQTQLSMMHLQTVQYQLQLFPHYLPIEIFVCIFVFITLSLIIANALGNAHLLRSQFGLGLASVFMAFSCFTTTIGILNYFHLWRHMVTPWYILIIVPIVASLENTFLLTNAMVNAGCDMRSQEKIGRGLESVGVPMTATLIAELIILAIGDAMRIPIVSDFCLFARLALIIGYLLEMTFFIAVLAINVKCVELTDLDDGQTSKRLRELSKYNIDADTAPDLCPIQEPIDECAEAKSCAECKQFKTHRTLNALVLCFIILILFRSSSWITSSVQQNQNDSTTSNDDILNNELVSTSTRFWSTVNPFHDSMQLQVNPPYLVVYTSTADDALTHVLQMEAYYSSKSKPQQQHNQRQQQQKMYDDSSIKHQFPRPPSRFRQLMLDIMKRCGTLLLSINIPSILLCVVLVGIIIWLTPSWREGWLRPLLKSLLIQTMNYCGFLLYRMLTHIPGSIGQRIAQELGDYDENGIHRGAILAQQQFNKQQVEHSIQQVDIKTLSGKHVADVRRLAANAKHGTLVSCGQDGRIILWDTQEGEWMARLDRVQQTHSGVMKGDLNPTYWRQPKDINNNSNKGMLKKRRALTNATISTVMTKQMMSARCVKIDQGNKWIASGFDDGMIRVWDMENGNLLRELRVETEIPIIVEEQDEQQPLALSGLRQRRQCHVSTTTAMDSVPLPSQQHTTTKQNRRSFTDRVIAVQFVGAVVEYCHPIVAEAAAKQAVTDNQSQNYLVSVHKSGIIREWDILSGECIQSIPSDHTRDITILHVVECKAPHPKLGVTWIFTASKDGVVKCWERRRLDNNSNSKDNVSDTLWTCAYTLNAHQGHAITALATELPIGGMGALVTGSSDGAVKVWNFETGEPICTLAAGGFIKQRNKEVPMVGGPLLKFSRIPDGNNNIRYDGGFSIQQQQQQQQSRRQRMTTLDPDTINNGSYESAIANDFESDHRGPITQVVIDRYCEVENGPGLCRGCDTCFGNGFFVASSSSDESVHVWRLERADEKHEVSCTLCTKDYRQKRYPTRSRNDDNNSSGKRPRRMSSPRRRVYRATQHQPTPTSSLAATSISETMELLDIEQLGGETNIALEPTFLGSIDQQAGRGLVFCNNMVLGGVRKSRQGDWEAWFASLKYYNPSDNEEDEEKVPGMIPVETFNLEKSKSQLQQDAQEASTHGDNNASILHSLWNMLYENVSLSTSHRSENYNRSQRKKRHDMSGKVLAKNSRDDYHYDDDEDEYDEASEMLPFSTIRHVVPLNGSGLVCDFGNFIKVVYLDDRYRKRDFHSGTIIANTANNPGVGGNIHMNIDTSTNLKITTSVQSKRSHSSSTCCSGNSKKNSQCCGGKNSVNGKCCGGKGHVNRRRTPVITTSPSGCNITDCSSQANCSRASECNIAPRKFGH
ncbi:hypothetical protein BDC45DRAFT_503331 [Circinella umbellata]|nr:hypothetical protein BDC45DRAFT_503331 [Circinella umbellata]